MEPTIRGVVYENRLASAADVDGFVLEGGAAVSFPKGALRLENALDPELGQEANFVFWCPEEIPDHVLISWDFQPLREPGLAILFFAARGHDGRDLFDAALAPRSGPYAQYHHGDLDALHVSYFRRKAPTERAFTTCNLRKSHGFHLVCQGADPLPGIADVSDRYRVQVVKSGPHVLFSIRQLQLFHWVDGGADFGPVLESGRIGFRQMAPLMAEYANLRVEAIDPLS
jgi:hypothetical protein